jgi:hypothetical protein
MSFLHTLCNRWGIFPRGSPDLAGGGSPPAIELPARFHHGRATLRPHDHRAMSDPWRAFAERRDSLE